MPGEQHQATGNSTYSGARDSAEERGRAKLFVFALKNTNAVLLLPRIRQAERRREQLLRCFRQLLDLEVWEGGPVLYSSTLSSLLIAGL